MVVLVGGTAVNENSLPIVNVCREPGEELTLCFLMSVMLTTHNDETISAKTNSKHPASLSVRRGRKKRGIEKKKKKEKNEPTSPKNHTLISQSSIGLTITKPGLPPK